LVAAQPRWVGRSVAGEYRGWLNFSGICVRVQINDRRVDNPHVPEAAIAYDERFLRDLYSKHGLIIERIVHGEWGRKGLVPHWQDEVWSSKLR